MKKLNLLIAGAVCLPMAMAMAQSEYNSTAGELFRAKEFSLDAFGTVSVGQQTINHISGNRVTDDGRLGAGIGLNYFLTRNIGVGGDAYTENTAHSFVDNASGNLIFRIPIDKLHLAPYVFGGGGYQFDYNEIWFAQAGGGLELRVSPNVGLFVDARYVFTDKVDNFGVARAGLRFAM